MASRPNLVELKNHHCYSDVSGRLDPYCLYKARAREHQAALEPGVERFAHMIFGTDLIASIAFALDVTSRFEFSNDLISPMNRTREFTCVRELPRSYSRRRVSHIRQNQVTCIGGTRDQGILDYKTHLNLGSAALWPQLTIKGFVSDSTVRTRTLTQKYGEFELFAPSIQAPRKSHTYTDTIDSTADTCGLTQFLHTSISDISSFTGPGATVPPSICATLLANERTNAATLMGEHAAGLIARALPEKRAFDLSYNIAELKDLPRTLRSSVELYDKLQGSLMRKKLPSFNQHDAANQYLNFKFGWEATIRSVREMLSLPTLVAKRVNYLLERNGKNTTYRSSLKFEEPMSSVPTFDYFNTVGEFNHSNEQTARRTVDLKCVVNAVINMPKVSVPELRDDLTAKLWGADIRPIDLYNIVPWTWLIDWYTGLGEYINAVDAINADPSLINYGFLTYKSVGDITGTYITKSTEYQSYSRSPPLTQWYTTSTRYYPYSCRLRFRYQLRKDIGTLPGVKAITQESTLSSEQQAIIGALLTRFTR